MGSVVESPGNRDGNDPYPDRIQLRWNSVQYMAFGNLQKVPCLNMNWLCGNEKKHMKNSNDL